METTTLSDEKLPKNGITKFFKSIKLDSAKNDESSCSLDTPKTNNFLINEPVLRNLLCGIPNEDNPVDLICTINRLLFYYTLVKWINFELWWYVGDGLCSVVH